MASRLAPHLRSDDDGGDLAQACDLMLTPHPAVCKRQLQENGNEHLAVNQASHAIMPPTQPSEDNADAVAATQGASSGRTGKGDEKRRSIRGRTRRHYSRKKAAFLSCTPALEKNANEMNVAIKKQCRRSWVRCASAAMDVGAGGAGAPRAPHVGRAASEPCMARAERLNRLARGNQSCLNPMRSFQNKAPHEMHREVVQKLSASDDGRARVFGQLSFGVVRLLSEEDVLQNEDGAILRGGVHKTKSLSKRGSLEEHYEKGSLKDLERRVRGKHGSGGLESVDGETCEQRPSQ